MKLINNIKYKFIDDEEFKRNYKSVLYTIKDANYSTSVKESILKLLDESVQYYPKYNNVFDIILKTLEFFSPEVLCSEMFIYQDYNGLSKLMKNDVKFALFLIAMAREYGVVCGDSINRGLYLACQRGDINAITLLQLRKWGIDSDNIEAVCNLLFANREFIDTFGIDLLMNLIKEHRSATYWQLENLLNVICASEKISNKKEFVNNIFIDSKIYDSFHNLSNIEFYIKNTEENIKEEDFKNLLAILNIRVGSKINQIITYITSKYTWLLKTENRKYLEKLIIMEVFLDNEGKLNSNFSYSALALDNFNDRIFWLFANKDFDSNRLEIIDNLFDIYEIDILEYLLKNCLNHYVYKTGNELKKLIANDIKRAIDDCIDHSEEVEVKITMRRIMQLSK